VFFHWQERHAHAIGTGLGQIESQLSALALKELVWDLEENAGAVASFRVAPAGSSVRQVEQYLNALGYNVVTFMAANTGDEADAAGIMLLRRMV
jgi:hypothetical protein